MYLAEFVEIFLEFGFEICVEVGIEPSRKPHEKKNAQFYLIRMMQVGPFLSYLVGGLVQIGPKSVLI